MHATLLGGLGVAGLATVAGYNTMSPTSQLYGRTFIGLPRGSRLLALTYDDGPNDPYTWRVMEVLERHGVKATFFLIGQFVRPEAGDRARPGRGRPRHRQSHLGPSQPDLPFYLRGAPPA